MVSPVPKAAIHSSSSAVVAAVVPLERDVTGLPVVSVLAILSSSGEAIPDHSEIRIVVRVELVQSSVTFPSAAPASLYQIPINPADPYWADCASV